MPTPSLRAHVARQLPGYGFCDAHSVWTTLPCAHCTALARVRAAMPTETRCYSRDPRPSDRSPRSAGV